nr:MAG TPA: hypothetical protein [Caudoviricetes sp.]
MSGSASYYLLVASSIRPRWSCCMIDNVSLLPRCSDYLYLEQIK